MIQRRARNESILVGAVQVGAQSRPGAASNFQRCLAIPGLQHYGPDGGFMIHGILYPLGRTFGGTEETRVSLGKKKVPVPPKHLPWLDRRTSLG